MNSEIQHAGSDQRPWETMHGDTITLTIGNTYRTRTEFAPPAGPTVLRLTAIDRTGKRFADDSAVGIVEVLQAPAKPEIVGTTTELLLHRLAHSFEECVLPEDALAETLRQPAADADAPCGATRLHPNGTGFELRCGLEHGHSGNHHDLGLMEWPQ